MRTQLGLVLATAIVVLPGLASAKRVAPKNVPPVTHRGVKYVFPHFSSENGKSRHGGVVEARDERSDALLWKLTVYEVWHKPWLESDVQDVFITSARMENEALIVTNERGEAYEIDVAKRTARRR
jgi:hypothetical protein